MPRWSHASRWLSLSVVETAGSRKDELRPPAAKCGQRAARGRETKARNQSRIDFCGDDAQRRNQSGIDFAPARVSTNQK
jgi:hypothetical protein